MGSVHADDGTHDAGFVGGGEVGADCRTTFPVLWSMMNMKQASGESMMMLSGWKRASPRQTTCWDRGRRRS